MIRSVIESRLEAKENDLLQAKRDLAGLNAMIQHFLEQRNDVIQEISDISYEILELKDELEEINYGRENNYSKNGRQYKKLSNKRHSNADRWTHDN